MTKEHMDLFLYFIVVFYDLCVCLWCVVAAEIELGPVRSRQRLSGAGPARLGPAGSSSFLNTDICSSWPWLETVRPRQPVGSPGPAHITTLGSVTGGPGPMSHHQWALRSGLNRPLIGQWWHIWPSDWPGRVAHWRPSCHVKISHVMSY